MPNKAIFLDRDDTIIDDPGYVNDPEQVVLLDGVCPALNELKKMGYKLIIVSNQSAVARGIVSEEVRRRSPGRPSLPSGAHREMRTSEAGTRQPGPDNRRRFLPGQVRLGRDFSHRHGAVDRRLVAAHP